MKIIKVLLLAIFLVSHVVFGETFIEKASKIESVYLKVEEKSYINNKKKEKNYTVKAKLPDMMYKEVEKPLINKGEIYIYKGNKKTVYLPKLKQTLEKDLDNEENYIMMVINDIKEVAKVKIIDNRFEDVQKVVYFNNKNQQITKIDYKDDLSIIFDEYNNEFPSKFSVYDAKNLVAEIRFLEVNTNVRYNDAEFVLMKNDTK